MEMEINFRIATTLRFRRTHLVVCLLTDGHSVDVVFYHFVLILSLLLLTNFVYKCFKTKSNKIQIGVCFQFSKSNSMKYKFEIRSGLEISFHFIFKVKFYILHSLKGMFQVDHVIKPVLRSIFFSPHIKINLKITRK